MVMFPGSPLRLWGYLGNTHMKVSEIQSLNPGDDPLMCVVSLLPEGWLLMSRDFSSMPVLAYSMTGSFVIPEADSTDNRFLFLSGYADQLKHVPMLKSDAPDPRWNPAYYYKESGQQKGVSVTVSPLIKVTWNQNSTWNRFCPANSEGPGRSCLCRMCCRKHGTGDERLRFPRDRDRRLAVYHSKYGTISQDFSTATPKWDEMSSTLPDDNNSLLLYHCAVAVNMDFSLMDLAPSLQQPFPLLLNNTILLSADDLHPGILQHRQMEKNDRQQSCRRLSGDLFGFSGYGFCGSCIQH